MLELLLGEEVHWLDLSSPTSKGVYDSVSLSLNDLICEVGIIMMSTPFRVVLWGLNVNPDTWQTLYTKQWMIWCSLLRFFSPHPHNSMSRHSQLYFREFYTHTHTHTHTHDIVAFSAEEGADPIDGARWTLWSYWEKGMRKSGRKKQRRTGQARVTWSWKQTISQDSVWTTEGQYVPHSASSAQHHHLVSWFSWPCCQAGVSLGYKKHILCLLLFSLNSTNTYFVFIVAKHCDRCQG